MLTPPGQSVLDYPFIEEIERDYDAIAYVNTGKPFFLYKRIRARFADPHHFLYIVYLKELNSLCFVFIIIHG